jgi:pimeloyl-ACP methyl ester carboxylesterase
VIDQCGHCPHIEKAAEFNEAVIAFFSLKERRGGRY